MKAINFSINTTNDSKDFYSFLFECSNSLNEYYTDSIYIGYKETRAHFSYVPIRRIGFILKARILNPKSSIEFIQKVGIKGPLFWEFDTADTKGLFKIGEITFSKKTFIVCIVPIILCVDDVDKDSVMYFKGCDFFFIPDSVGKNIQTKTNSKNLRFSDFISKLIGNDRKEVTTDVFIDYLLNYSKTQSCKLHDVSSVLAEKYLSTVLA